MTKTQEEFKRALRLIKKIGRLIKKQRDILGKDI